MLSNMDMVLAKSDTAIASRYSDLVSDPALREAIFSRLRAAKLSPIQPCKSSTRGDARGAVQ
jgi:phosphoenolpyruvate carboxylase